MSKSIDQHPSAPIASTSAPIDPQLRPFVSELVYAQPAEASAGNTTIDAARRRAELIRTRWRRGGPAMIAVEDSNIPTRRGAVRVRRFVPRTTDALQPALIYLHGGGWTMFSLDTHDRIMRELAARANVVVVGVDYALSPEAKFPLALEQIDGVVRRLVDHGTEYGIDSTRLAIGGDSSGANLAVGTTLLLRDAGIEDAVRGMLLMYGCFTPDPTSLAQNAYGAAGNVLTSEEMATFWDNYLTDPADAHNPLAAPLLARLEGLPPTFQVIAQCDVLATQNHAFTSRLREAGVAVEAREYVGATHSFLEAVSIADVAGRALEDSAQWLRGCLCESSASALHPTQASRPAPNKP